jgi:excinuclease UvrABC ATPase subunit
MSKNTNKGSQETIDIYGAREHNLKDITLQIPRNKLIVFTGLSGSGKSSLAFDTIFAEGQRRYIDTFSSYVKQFIGGLERPDVDKIDGLSPVIAIEQKPFLVLRDQPLEQSRSSMISSAFFLRELEQRILMSRMNRW